jgi:putative PEP-CTERM system integral membrane protein
MILVRQLFNPRAWAYGLFWSWNLIFLAFMLLGFAPLILPELLTAVRAGEVPEAFLITGLALTMIPVVAVVLGLTILRREPGRLFALGYGVEGPLMLLLALRFFLVRDLTPVVAVMLTIAGLGLLTYLWELLDKNMHAHERAPLLAYPRGLGLTLLLMTGLYVGLWIAFYAVPLSVFVPSNLGQILSDSWRSLTEGGWRWLPFTVLGITLFFYSATLFVVMPVAIPILYLRAWQRGMRRLIAAQGWPSELRTFALNLGVLAASAALIAITLPQPQHAAFQLLQRKPANRAEAQALLDQQETIRAGLVNAYLAPLRYMSAVGEVMHVRDIYHEIGFTPEQADGVRRFYEVVARPVLYEPVQPRQEDNWALVEEPNEAARLYQEFFDEPLIEGEREMVTRAARSSWSPDQARTAWQAVDDREIHLLRQEVTVAEHGDWAEVELYEVYQNQTSFPQEVVYYFSLPESAVVTGVWLGNSADRDTRFTYHVAPRGAAQAVYQSQFRRNLDPALVEQIGPCQYRLRVFPVSPQQRDWESDEFRSRLTPGPEMHMWLTYRVLASGSTWPLPRLAEKRNVYWDTASIRLVNGQPMVIGADAWLPVSAPTTSPTTPTAHRVDFGNGQSVVAYPVTAETLPAIPNDLRLAVVLDRSLSMAGHAEDVKAALARLRELNLAVEVYLTSSAYHGEAPTRMALAEVKADSLVYLGGQNAAELLQQYEALQAGEDYDAILVLTDGSGYELGPSAAPTPTAAGAPVWMIHLGEEFPLGYDDATLETIQASGGGAAGSVDEALIRLMAARGSAELRADVMDGYVWQTIATEAAAHVPVDEAFAPLAARQLILSTLPNPRRAAERLEALDALHALAREASIVTPYSSMIVLVTEQQEALLKQAETRQDRFDREYEEVGETSPFTVTGVPEPEEWLLLTLAMALLVFYIVRSRRQRAPLARAVKSNGQ